MSSQENIEFTDCRSDLLNALTIAQDRAARGRANDTQRQLYETKVEQLTIAIGDLVETGNHLKDIYKNIQAYATKHQQKARDILDLAIAEAANLVPDAYEPGIHLSHGENSKVFVVNERGQNVNIREGGGYRVILGVLLRYACIKAQPDSIPLMLLDEQLFTMSDTTTDVMKPIFEAMKKDLMIICIEQRRNAVGGITDREYTFQKGKDLNTTVIQTL